MAKIHVQPDCGNAPRKLFLKEWTIAIAEGNEKFLMETSPENLTWEIVGQNTISGKQNYLTGIKKSHFWKIKELVVDTIITHGPDGAVSGTLTIPNQSKFSFCNIYRFKGAAGKTIKSITSFIIRM